MHHSDALNPGVAMKTVIRFSILLILSAAFALVTNLCNAEEIPVNSYYGHYDADQKKPGFPSKSLIGPKPESWETPKPKKQYHVAVLIPHLQDSYWKTASYGIMRHAGELGVKITLYEAGGYGHVGKQRSQLERLADNEKVDGIILASVNYTKLDDPVAKSVDNGTPVIELINDIHAPKIQGKALVSFFEMGYKAGEFVLNHSEGKDIKVAFYPGPEKSGWAPDTFLGFQSAIENRKNKNQKIAIVGPFYGDTRPGVQAMRIRHTLGQSGNQDIDYVIGCATAVSEAVNYLEQNRDKLKKVKIVSTYITDVVYDLIEKGAVLASPSDQTIQQTMPALDMMVRVLNGEQPGKDFPFRTGPIIPVISEQNIKNYSYESLFGSKDFVPIVQKWK